MSVVDMAGMRVGRLTVVERSDTRGHGAMWLCICDCGGSSVVLGKNLRKGNVRSCGCLATELRRSRATRHGHAAAASPEYTTWKRINARCGNPRDRVYPRYGGRGIRVCERWATSFETFLEDMGPRPSPRHSIDRIDNDGHYEPGNCRWATARQQARNRRNNLPVTIGGVTRCLAEWAEEFGADYILVKGRVRSGWDPLKALTRPSRQKKSDAEDPDHG